MYENPNAHIRLVLLNILILFYKIVTKKENDANIINPMNFYRN